MATKVTLSKNKEGIDSKWSKWHDSFLYRSTDTRVDTLWYFEEREVVLANAMLAFYDTETEFHIDNFRHEIEIITRIIKNK